MLIGLSLFTLSATWSFFTRATAIEPASDVAIDVAYLGAKARNQLAVVTRIHSNSATALPPLESVSKFIQNGLVYSAVIIICVSTIRCFYYLSHMNDLLCLIL